MGSRAGCESENRVTRLLILLPLVLATALVPAQTRNDALIARAKALELDTPYVAPPGDPLELHAAGYAKVMCSAVFVTGLDPDFARDNVGFFTGPYEERARLGKPVIDRAAKAVHVTLPNGVKRTARYLGDQGCVTLPPGKRMSWPAGMLRAATTRLSSGRR